MRTHHLFRIGGRVTIPAALLCAGILGISTAASAAVAGAPVQAPDHPFPGTSAACDALIAQQTSLGSHNYPDAEVEPYMVANPVDPMHLVAAFQQDRWNDGGANGTTTVVSDNGGKSWTLASGQPALTVCQGATSGSSSFFNRASDPWVSYSPDGKTVYQATPAFRGPAVFSMTTDGGKTWSPSRIIFDPGQKNQTIDNQIVVVPTGAAKGTLVDGFTRS